MLAQTHTRTHARTLLDPPPPCHNPCQVADLMAPRHRAASAAFVLAMFSVGLIIGPLVGRFMTPNQAVYTCMGLTSLAGLYVLVFVPETAPRRCVVCTALGLARSMDTFWIDGVLLMALCSWHDSALPRSTAHARRCMGCHSVHAQTHETRTHQRCATVWRMSCGSYGV
jgi:hypothetical protein